MSRKPYYRLFPREKGKLLREGFSIVRKQNIHLHLNYPFTSIISMCYMVGGWVGVLLCSLQCLGVLLLRVILGQGPAVLAAGVVWVLFFFFSSILSSLSNAQSLGRRLDITAILWSLPLDPKCRCHYYRGRARLVLVNRFDALSLLRNSASRVNWSAGHDLDVDRTLNFQNRQTICYRCGYL